ncbi:MAG: hypothetical protein ACSLFH_04525, partial [Desulfuromonadales bacterium]
MFDSDPGFEGGNIGGFAQAADDTRAVINYMHSWPLPADYATPLVSLSFCPGSDDLNYDVSISPESGLQVPEQMVDAKIEGREFSVTVANAGPDTASGKVTVDAVAAKGGAIFLVEVVVGEDGVTSYLPGDPPPWEFAFADLRAEGSASFSGLFSTSFGEKDEITWEATVDADDDVLLTNNTVNATTNVLTT